MESRITWEKKAYQENHLRNNIYVARVTQAPLPNQSQSLINGRLESFCLPSCEIAACFDDIPITKAVLTLTMKNHHVFMPKPHRVHYGFATNKAYEWKGAPCDSFFEQDDGYASTWTAHFDLRDLNSPVIGLSFVIQLDDGTWMKDAENNFYIGSKRTDVPSSVEISFPNPPSVYFIPGRILALHRMNPFWWHPLFNAQGLHSCMHETQFILAQFQSTHLYHRNGTAEHDPSYIAFLMTIDIERELRASLFGIHQAEYAAIRIDNGTSLPIRVKDIQGAIVCICASARSPYEAVRAVVNYAAKEMATFSSRLEKISSPRWYELSRNSAVLNSLGFCTWDAFGHRVTEESVENAIGWFRENDIPIGFVIVDDGWQAGGGEGPQHHYNIDSAKSTGRPTMSSFNANEKFSGSLRSLADKLGAHVIAWTAIIGYWGGTNGNACDVETELVTALIPKGLRLNEIEDHGHWEKRFEIVKPTADNVNKFFQDYFLKSMALKQGVSSVKVDAQSVLEMMSNSEYAANLQRPVTRVSLAAAYRKALSTAIRQAFPDTVVMNCMACGPETIFYSGSVLSEGNVCWRTSNDHAFPDVEEGSGTVGWHILCNAMNSMLLGEIFPIVDWDMFRAGDRWADIHALARVVSGGPLYISDHTPLPSTRSENAKRMLGASTTRSGKVLRCEYPGRPVIDSLFHDPRVGHCRSLKIFNRTTVLGLLGLFNINNCDEKERFVTDWFAPYQVEDFDRAPSPCEYISFVSGSAPTAFHHRDRTHRHQVTLSSMTAVLVHICPVFHVSEHIRFATIGQPHLLNCGASVASISISTVPRSSPRLGKVECHLLDAGEVYLWLDEHSLQCLSNINFFTGHRAPSPKIVYCGEVKFSVLDVPPVEPYGITLYFADT